MDVAKTIASRSYDPILQVGAVIVSDDNTTVLSLGYNGNAKGLPNKRESDEPGLSGYLHAELNALLKAPYNYNGKKVMYVTHSPCRMCCKCIMQCKIDRVVYLNEYRDTSALQLLRDAGIEVIQYSDVEGV